MNPVSQIKLDSLMEKSLGSPSVQIGIIDGPVDFDHPAFEESKIRTLTDLQRNVCKGSSSIACIHGTFIVGMLCAKRGSRAPAICPNCKILLRPIFEILGNQNNGTKYSPTSTPEELAEAIVEMVRAGAKIINLSLGLTSRYLITHRKLQEAYDYAFQKGVIVVAAAGNQGGLGYISILDHPWILPVTACKEDGSIHEMSNFGPSIGKRGLMAPGVNIVSTSPGGKYSQFSGTSFAAPFVSGAVALLWSLHPKATPAEVIYSIRHSISPKPRSMFPSLLDAEMAETVLSNMVKTKV